MIKKYGLEFTVFVAGAVVMIVELAGSRLLAPYVGTSIYVWTNLIGVIMISLSLGYWWGGRLAKGKADYPTLSTILFWSGVCVGLTYLFHDPLLIYIQKYFTSVRSGAFLASLILFAPASILLGMISPYAVALKVKDIKEVGVDVGTLYAISTMGSIAGTFLTGYILISSLGSSLITLLATLALLGLSLFNDRSLKRLITVLIVTGIFLAIGSISSNIKAVADVDTMYGRVRIVDTDSNFILGKVRLMMTGNVMGSGIKMDGTPAFPYIDFYKVAGYFNPAIEKALVIGGAAYTLPQELLKNNSEMRVDVVEIDPAMTQLAQKYFGLKIDDRLKVFHEDGRTYLNRVGRANYDAIYLDAFGSYTPPFQLTSIEVVKKMYEALDADGVILVNILSSLQGERGRLLGAQYKTYSQVFPYIYVFPVGTPNPEAMQNIMLVASKNKQVIKGNEGEFREELSHLWTRELAGNVVVLTDEFAPVEAYGESFF